jgi:small subunit ribosomal protein S2
MPFVTERWLGGMLTNFATVRKSIKKCLTLTKCKKMVHTMYCLKKS